MIIGTEAVNCLVGDQLKVHKRQDSLHPELAKQYSIDELPGMILSPRSRKYSSGCPCCTCCYGAMRPSLKNTSQPAFSLANDFAIGSIPRKLYYKTHEGELRHTEINDKDLTDLLCLFLAPVRPYGCILAHTRENTSLS